jgi:hypothetical protein
MVATGATGELMIDGILEAMQSDWQEGKPSRRRHKELKLREVYLAHRHTGIGAQPT